jgi:biopolymer transport protein ExbD
MPHPATQEHIRRKRKNDPPSLRYVPNVVPLIDVLFLLLLFFLLNSHFRQAEGDIPGSLPSAQLRLAGGILKETVLTIRPVGLDRLRAVYEIDDGLPIEEAGELFNQLQARKAGLASEESPLVLSPVGDVRWKFVVEAYNQAYRAKFRNITFRYPTPSE